MLDTGHRIQLEVIEVLVGEVMTTPAVMVGRTSTVEQAIRLLYEQNITAAPVIDEDGHPRVDLRSVADVSARPRAR